ncbi:hypothetical protein ACRALDRAFT_210531 [Sodiomyces alcalophilus JCM 7366]|uniref:uncharacterized protein n=1 Tax=Sodiomyces alcalophilus JCM 7366 TaxID=591952 RepID=UPI0039B5488B
MEGRRNGLESRQKTTLRTISRAPAQQPYVPYEYEPKCAEQCHQLLLRPPAPKPSLAHRHGHYSIRKDQPGSVPP